MSNIDLYKISEVWFVVSEMDGKIVMIDIEKGLFRFRGCWRGNIGIFRESFDCKAVCTHYKGIWIDESCEKKHAFWSNGFKHNLLNNMILMTTYKPRGINLACNQLTLCFLEHLYLLQALD